MIFYDAFSMGPLITKSSKIGKRVQFSLSLSTQKETRANKHHHHHQIMEVADIAIAPLKEFVRDSARLVKKCTKPDRREFTLIASKTAFGASSRSTSSSSSSSLSFFVCPLPHVSRFFGGNQIHIYIYRDVVSLWVSPKNVLSPPPSKRDDRVYHVWVRRVLRETGLVSVSLRSLFTLNQQSHQYSFLDEIEYTDYGSFFPCRVAMRFDDARAKYLLTGVSFFLLTQHTN